MITYIPMQATNIEIGQKVEIFSVIGNIGGALSKESNKKKLTKLKNK